MASPKKCPWCGTDEPSPILHGAYLWIVGPTTALIRLLRDRDWYCGSGWVETIGAYQGQDCKLICAERHIQELEAGLKDLIA